LNVHCTGPLSAALTFYTAAQADAKTAGFTHCIKELFLAGIVTMKELRECLNGLLTFPSDSRVEAAAYLLSIIDPHMDSVTSCGPEERLYLGVHYDDIERWCNMASRLNPEAAERFGSILVRAV